MALVTKSFSDIITFTRASTGTFFNSAGVLTSAAINAPRFDYNPSTLAAQGLLIEEARTNSLLRSAEFDNALWVKTRATVTANTATAPDGTTSADSIVEDGTAANTHDLRQGGVVNSATTNWTLSFFLKAVNRTWALIELQNATATGNRARAWFNLQTGVVGTGNAAGSGVTYVSHSIQNVGNGWYRCVVVGTVDISVTNIQSWVEGTIADNTSNYDGVNGQTSIYIWGAQLEAGAFPTSYIPTTTTALTRNADQASVNTLSPWYNSAVGTLFVQGILVGGAAATFPRMVALVGSNPDTDDIGIAWTANTGTMRFTVRVGAAAQADIAVGPSKTAGSSFKVAGRYAVNDFQAAADGVLGTPDTTGTLPTITALSLGGPVSFQPRASVWLQRVTFYPRGLSNAELQAITV